jgi:hypothetical protein
MTAGVDRRLGELVADAVHRLDAATGGAAVCTVTRSGAAVPGIKYAEGRWAALREVERAVRVSSAGPPAAADTAAVVASVLAAWRAALDHATARSGADWVAYRTGGVDALTDLTR